MSTMLHPNTSDLVRSQLLKEESAYLEVDLNAVSKDDGVGNLHHGGLHVQGHHQS